jgi:5-methylcytosine-specific restriction endonuclease McrA
VPGHVINLLNQRFGKIVVKEFLGVENRNAVWRCECDCGEFANLQGGQLRAGNWKSCGCLNARRRPYEALYNNLVYNAKRRNHMIALSYEDFLFFVDINTCHYCGAGILWEKVMGHGTLRHNLDRKENSLGYSLDNCVVCCYDCNATKGDRFTFKEFMLLAPILRAIRQRRI